MPSFLFCLLDDVNMSIICDRVHRIELQKSIKVLVAMATLTSVHVYQKCGFSVIPVFRISDIHV